MKERDWQLNRLDKKSGFNIDPLQTPELEVVARAFVENVKKLEALKVFPFFSAGTAYNFGRTIGGAAMKLSDSIAEIPADSEHFEAYVSMRAALLRFLMTDDPDADIDAFLERSTGLVADVAGNVLGGSGIEAWLSALVVNSWTSFETLAGGLWEATLNCHPHGLSELKGAKAQGEKTVGIGLLQKYSFDLSKQMGTLLKEKRAFDRLEDIRENYELAFYIDGAKINKALSDALLDTLSSVRDRFDIAFVLAQHGNRRFAVAVQRP